MSELSKYKIWQPLLLSTLVGLGMIIGVKMAPELRYTGLPEENFTANDALEKYYEVLKYIEGNYVDSIHLEGFVERMIRGGLESLDPHSIYLSKEEVKLEAQNRNGIFTGIGIDFFEYQDTLIIKYVVPESPADSAGIQLLDKLLNVNQRKLTESENQKSSIIAEELDAGQVTITKMGRNGEIVPINLSKQPIDLSPIDMSIALGEIGYIKISRFTKNTYASFMNSLEKLIVEKGIKDLIIDVRDNPGGYMQDAIQILSQFFPQKGQTLVSTKRNDGRERAYKSDGRVFFEINDLAVLINENSASASEIIAGVIQDLDRGTIIGSESFGKGLVQQQFNLSDSSALILTTERYYTPSGRMIQRDYQQSSDVFKTLLQEDTSTYFTKKGHSVNGRNGIVPDLKVSAEDYDVVPENIDVQEIAYQAVLQNALIEEIASSKEYFAQFFPSDLSEAQWHFLEKQVLFEIKCLISGREEAKEWYIQYDPIVIAALENFN